MLNSSLPALLAKVARIKTENQDCYIEIKRLLNIAFKYRVLRQLRVNYLSERKVNFHDQKHSVTMEVLNQLSRAQLLELKTWDLAAKKFVYGQSIDLVIENKTTLAFDEEKMSAVLSPQAITILLQKNALESMQILQRMKTSLYHTIILQWKTLLAQCIDNKTKDMGWLSWLGEKSMQFKDSVYSFSWVGICSHLGTIIAENLGAPRTGKWIGTSVGVSISYYFGCYAFVRSAVVGSLSASVAERIRAWQLLDQSAEIKSSIYPLEPYHTAHAIALAEGLAHGLYQGSVFPFFKSLVGSVASVLSLVVVDNCRARRLASVKTRNAVTMKALTNMAISLLMIQFGKSMVSLVENAYINSKVNQAFFKLLGNSLDSTFLEGELIVSTPNPWSLNFWLTRKQLVNIFWRPSFSSFFFKQTCELSHISDTGYYANANCSEPSLLENALLI